MNQTEKWVIVTNPGTDHQDEVASFRTYREAAEAKRADYPDVDADIMKRTSENTLTTEY